MSGIARFQLFSRRIATFALLFLVGCRASDEAEREVIPVGVEEGNRPPPLDGMTATGEPYTLPADGGDPIVLVFYRSATCGLCRVQLQLLQSHLPAYARQDAVVVAVTLDTPTTSQALAEEMQISFPLVSVDSTVFADWGVMDPELRVPLPASYILDRSGRIHFRHIGRNASDRTSDAGLVTILEGMSES